MSRPAPNMTFELEPYLDRARLDVERALAERMQALQSGVPSRLHQAMAYSLLAGGKRLRPILCLAFAQTVRPGAESERLTADAACALEMVHTYSLVHDDLPCMDDDDLRRGRPTNHKVFGEGMAVLAGDSLLTEAFALLASTSAEPSAARLSAVAELAQASGAAGMIGGQVLDIAEDRPDDDRAYLTRMHRLKTGALIRAACRMGVIAAGGSAAALAAAGEYGEAWGLAFQLADDLLDVTSTAAELGKPTGADAAAGRFTFPALLGVEGTRALAEETVEKALQSLRQLEPSPGPLAALARYSVERRS